MTKIRSEVWGGQEFEISQNFGTFDPETAAMYPAEYTEPLGYPAGTHLGLDIQMPRGTKIYALNRGKVVQGGPQISEFFRPKPVWIETDDDPDTQPNEQGYIEIYGHLWENFVKPGDRVTPGEQIGISGEQTVKGTMTPDGTGPHLHFELRRPGERTSSGYKAINPASWLTKNGVQVDQPKDDNSPKDEGGNETAANEQADGALAILQTLQQYAPQAVLVVVGVGILVIGLKAIT